jgi:two-component system, cell cycle sensor histidine kinase and response regulator CckA
VNPPTILVVEDNPITRKMMRFALESEKYTVLEAQNGETALHLARGHRLDLVLQDFVLPDMDGLQLITALRALPGGSTTPVLVITGLVSQIDDLRERADDRTSVLPKPIEPSRLVDIVKAQLAGGSGPVGEGGDLAEVQLEEQPARPEALVRQEAIQAAALSVIRGLSLALAQPGELPKILGDVLVHSLDAAGLSTGLLYLANEAGRLELQAQAGLPASARATASSCFGHLEILVSALDSGEPAPYGLGQPGLGVGPRALLEGLAKASALIVPFVVGQERVGALALASNSQDLSQPAWLEFARTLAMQFGQAIALGRTLARGAASEARYRSLMEHANDAILVFPPDLTILEANRRAEELLGCPKDQIVGRSYASFFAREDQGGLTEDHATLLAEGATRVQDRRVVRTDGSVVSVDVSASLVRIGEETVVLSILHDASDRKRAEAEYRLLFDRNPHPIFVFDRETLAFLAVNEAAVRLYGFSRDEFLGMTIKEIRPVEEVPALLDYLATMPDSLSLKATQVIHRKKDGSILEVAGYSSPIEFRGRHAHLVLVNDVTEKKGLEAQLLQAQKMEAVGRLAGGVAHDFNNLLGVITGYSELLLKDLGPEHPGLKCLAEIQKAADRAASLTRQLLAFSRQQVLQPRILDLDEVVANVEAMLRRLIGEDIHLVTKRTAGLGHVRADPGQIEQVLMNLVVNARDAMPKGGGLILETANIVLDEAYSSAHPEVRPGPFVLLSVTDTGEGMNAETRAHLFEPFFTTKAAGKGTGLGLATVFGIVQQSGGSVRVDSQLGLGTTCNIYFPRVEDALSRPSVGLPGAPPPGGTETVLLVEDADSLREMIREILESAGYDVLESSDPEEALFKVSTLDSPVRLILTDVVMPGMSGPELAKSIQTVRPDIKVLFMSGYTDEAVGLHGVLSAGTHFIQKPFPAEALLRKVREAIDEP